MWIFSRIAKIRGLTRERRDLFHRIDSNGRGIPETLKCTERFVSRPTSGMAVTSYCGSQLEEQKEKPGNGLQLKIAALERGSEDSLRGRARRKIFKNISRADQPWEPMFLPSSKGFCRQH